MYDFAEILRQQAEDEYAVGDIYLVLHRRPNAQDYHWSIALVGIHASERGHVRGSQQNRSWTLFTHERTNLKGNETGTALVNVRIGYAANSDIETFWSIVGDQTRVKNGEQHFTCRIWAIDVVQGLAEAGLVKMKPNTAMRALEAEMWTHGDYGRLNPLPDHKPRRRAAQCCEQFRV